MKARIVAYNYQTNSAIFEFDSDFATTYDRFHDSDVNVDVKKWYSKRTGAANRLLWVLVDKIAKELRMTKEEVYRREIKEIGGVSDVCVVLNDAVDKFCASWEQNGIGWQTEVLPIDDEKSNVIVYYGSSMFDKDQMAQLLDNLIYEAEQLGIDTDTPDKQLWWESLMEENDGRG